MFYNAKPHIFEKAKLLRKHMTKAEKLVWEELKNNKLGVKFRAQHPVDIFIADFYCHSKKLILEIDGEIHKSQLEYDVSRTNQLNLYGITVIRYTNNDVYSKLNEIIEQIKNKINESPTP